MVSFDVYAAAGVRSPRRGVQRPIAVLLQRVHRDRARCRVLPVHRRSQADRRALHGRPRAASRAAGPGRRGRRAGGGAGRRAARPARTARPPTRRSPAAASPRVGPSRARSSRRRRRAAAGPSPRRGGDVRLQNGPHARLHAARRGRPSGRPSAARPEEGRCEEQRCERAEGGGPRLCVLRIHAASDDRRPPPIAAARSGARPRRERAGLSSLPFANGERSPQRRTVPPAIPMVVRRVEGVVAEHRPLKWTSSLQQIDTTAVQPGDVIAGRFEIDGRAGAGGMGEVFRARDRSSGRHVAVKVLLERRLDDEVRFTREAAVLSALRHPGIVEYVTDGETPSGQRYLVMEWLAGEDLSVRLARGALGVDEALALGARVAEALAAAHARGVVHRDLKPSNIFLVERDVTRAKVLDFGIARRGDAKTITRAGALLGTPGYMAPEQARSGRDVDARADVFALGCVLFECLTGTPAFLGDDLIAILAKVLAEEAPRVRERCPQVPEALEQLVSRMLAREPEERPGDAAAVAEELEALRGAQRRPSVHTRRSRSTQPPSLTGGERRILSVVLLGKQPPADDGAPTLCEAELSSVQGELRRTAADHGGLLEVLVDGTAIVTLARTTQVPTDQAAQAARCALALRAVSRDRPVVLATGRSEVTGRLCAGDAIDRAARMLAAPPARGRDRPVAIDEVTAGLLDARFEVVETDAGLELRAERELAEGARTLLGKATACVGRDWEIATLEALLQECFEEPLARAVLITAPAGMGKSRIASELTGRLRQRCDEVAIWTGRVDSLRAGSSFGLLGQVLRSALSLRDGEPLEARRDKIRARVAGSTPAADQRGIAAFLGEIVDTPFADEESVALRTARQNAQLMSDQLRKAWLEFLRAEVAQRPVLLVLEDLHWGDQPTVSFLDAALRDLRAMPWMVLALARPEVHETFPRLWAERQTQEIRLKELPRKACERLVRQALGASIGREMLERIVALAGGHAFYLEELIRAVAEGRGEALPETVLAMVEARLSRLDPEARRLLRAASVFGEVCCKRETNSTRKNNIEQFQAVSGYARHGRQSAGGDGGHCVRAIGGARAVLVADHRGRGFGTRCAWGRSYGGAEPDVGSFHRAPLRLQKAGPPSQVRRTRPSLVASAGVQAARGRGTAGL
ncbi:protein kinase domain-containing protein [Sorangium sp. So ce861]|uniref:serine/threonine-protein kinase n=1 Tax=Sorangium sp. So ce861 TaxID=3133323 RepID=UPI003F5EBC81